MKKKTIWISYDLGVRGDYDGLYAWLDDKGAKECGSSVAVIKVADLEDSICEKIKKEIGEKVKVDSRTRIYLIYRDPATNLNKGRFIFGGRRSSPWEGYGEKSSGVDTED